MLLPTIQVLNFFWYMFLLCSGKTVSRFIPVGKILKPVLVECVTPVTCYWSLSLLLRGEEQLTLVFKVNAISLFQYIVRETFANIIFFLLAVDSEFSSLFVYRNCVHH